MSRLRQRKADALFAVDQVFSTPSASEREAIEALEEIRDRCEENIATLREQIRNEEATR